MEKYGRAGQFTDDNIWRMRFACWITWATDRHSECVIRIAFPQQQWLWERRLGVTFILLLPVLLKVLLEVSLTLTTVQMKRIYSYCNCVFVKDVALRVAE